MRVRVLDTKEATEYLKTLGFKLSDTTLQDYRRLSHPEEGPNCVIMFGRQCYTKESLDAWVAKKMMGVAA